MEVARAVRARGPRLALRGVDGFEGLDVEATDEAIAGFMQFLVRIAEACDREDLFGEDPVLLSAGGSAHCDIVVDVFLRAELGRPTQVVTQRLLYRTRLSHLHESHATGNWRAAPVWPSSARRRSRHWRSGPMPSLVLSAARPS